MKKILFSAFVALFAAVSCNFYTFSDPEPDVKFEPVVLPVNTTVAQLKEMYKDGPTVITGDIVIGGQVVSSDQSGNLYRSLYIQDTTGAIELKIGKSSLYNDYKLGQWVYVKCKGLALGQYGGMVQLGFRTDEPAWTGLESEYETAYLDVQYIIDSHIFKGPFDTPLEPILIDEKGIKDAANFGKYVRVEGLLYGNQVFTIIYDKSKNSIYLSGKTCGIDSWAMSANGFKEYMIAGTGKVEPQSAFDGMVSKESWQSYYDAASAYAVSQYFTIGKTDLQVRTSGYAKFADTKIDKKILGGAKVNFTGILTYYNGNNQFTLLDLNGVEITN